MTKKSRIQVFMDSLFGISREDIRDVALRIVTRTGQKGETRVKSLKRTKIANCYLIGACRIDIDTSTVSFMRQQGQLAGITLKVYTKYSSRDGDMPQSISLSVKDAEGNEIVLGASFDLRWGEQGDALGQGLYDLLHDIRLATDPPKKRDPVPVLKRGSDAGPHKLLPKDGPVNRGLLLVAGESIFRQY